MECLCLAISPPWSDFLRRRTRKELISIAFVSENRWMRMIVCVRGFSPVGPCCVLYFWWQLRSEENWSEVFGAIFADFRRFIFATDNLGNAPMQSSVENVELLHGICIDSAWQSNGSRVTTANASKSVDFREETLMPQNGCLVPIVILSIPLSSCQVSRSLKRSTFSMNTSMKRLFSMRMHRFPS